MGGDGGSIGEETIFVAVGKKLERNKTTLSWALRNFQGKKICLLHVHKPTLSAESNGTHSALKNGCMVLQQDIEMERMHGVLNEYLAFLDQEGVEADKAWIEMDDVGKGIVEGILCHNIRWLVMGGAASKYCSKKLSWLKSRKAIFVCQNAPKFSHIWFIYKGCLIYTRDAPETEAALPLLSLTADSGTELVKLSGKELVPVAYRQKSLDYVINNSGHVMKQKSRSGDFSSHLRNGSPFLLPLYSDGNESESECSENLAITCKTSSESDDGAAAHDIYYRLEEVLMNAKSFRRNQFDEAVRRWKAEDDAMDVKKKATALETSCSKEANGRKDLEKALAIKRQDLDTMKNQRREVLAELEFVQEQNSILENRLSGSRLAVAELEEKILCAVELLISFKAQRDELRIEHGNAMKEVNKLRRSVRVDGQSFCGSQIVLFSFEEIVKATNSFDPSLRIGKEGKHGTVFRGTLRHAQVAIKMLPSFGSPRNSDFQHEMELSTRVRHPNLVTLIGTCPESRTLVYEYLKNGSLEDRLSCKGKTRPFSWQARSVIACDVCSALVFLHSHEPPIAHGNLKPSNILLDANFVSKISDLGIFHLTAENENSSETTSDSASDIYSFGIILLQLVSGSADPDTVKDVKCALEKGNFETILDDLAGEWPLDQAVQLVQLGLRCCDGVGLDRAGLVSDVWTVLEQMRALSIVSASNARFKEAGPAPAHFVCPIFQEVMKEPLIAADGFTYEAEAIQGWLKSHNTSPMTNLKLETSDLVPNHALLNAIQEWRQLV